MSPKTLFVPSMGFLVVLVLLWVFPFFADEKWRLAHWKTHRLGYFTPQRLAPRRGASQRRNGIPKASRSIPAPTTTRREGNVQIQVNQTENRILRVFVTSAAHTSASSQPTSSAEYVTYRQPARPHYYCHQAPAESDPSPAWSDTLSGRRH